MNPAPRPRRSRLAAAAALVLGAGVVWLGARDTPSAPQIAPSPPPPAAAAPAPRAAAAPRPPPPPAPTPAPAPRSLPNRAPRLASAALDRTRLCPGESTLLRMTAEDPDGDDLRYRATLVSPALGGPRFGFGRWLRVEAPEQVGRYGVLAVVEDAARARDEIPLELWVDACDAPPPFDASQLAMRHTELDAATHEFELGVAAARVRDAGKSFEVVRWHFGDGATQAGGLRARHRYPVLIDRRYSYYLVQAEVRVDGVPSLIEYGLSRYSYAAANLDAGYVALAADVERGDDSGASVQYVVTFSNVTPFSAWARELLVTCLDAAGLARERWREPLDLTVPGEASLEQTLVLDRQRCPGGASYEVFGEADGGYAVGGLWAYRLRPTAPAPDARRAREQARRVLLGQTRS